MTVTTLTTDRSAETLLLVDETPGPWSATLLADYLASFEFLYQAALHLEFGHSALQASDFTFVRSGPLFPPRIAPSRMLIVQSLRTGSLAAELGELAPVIVGGLAGGGLVTVARLLVAGPRELAGWAALPIEVRRRRAEERTRLAQAQLIQLEAEQRALEIRSATPSLQLGVRASDGSEIMPLTRLERPEPADEVNEDDER